MRDFSVTMSQRCQMVSEAPADSRRASLLMILNYVSLGCWSISYMPPMFPEGSQFEVVTGVEVCAGKCIAFHSESFRRETNSDDTALLFCTQTAHRSLHILLSPLPASQERGWWVSAFGCQQEDSEMSILVKAWP